MRTLKEKLDEVVTASLDILFPPSCPFCKKMTKPAERFLCGECFSQLKFITTPYCTCCGRVFAGSEENHLCGDCLKSSWAFDTARSLFSYEKIIAGLIHKLKYSGKTTGLETFRWLSEQSNLLQDFDVPDFILPVPLHRNRLRHRGFNQALVLAKSIFPGDRKKIRHDLLTRQANTPTQTGLSGIERRKNLKHAFVIEKPAEVKGRKILLLDDVFTTGATVQECAKALKFAGTTRVDVLTIGRADKIFL
ncbi:MAG: ComF family protein [Desulfocapsa sp.]|jgi:ComF family protein|nr:ComF family protein [Desulfocapsa sp.]